MSERGAGGRDDAADERGAAAEKAPSGDAPGETRDGGRRRGLEGKGFDAGTGYGGAGGDSAYDGESSYGGQAGYGGSVTRGAYTGGKYGRPDDPDGPFAGRGEEPAPDDWTDQDAAGGER